MILLNTIKKELNALDIKPKKSLGQNFLVNEGVYKKIVAALEIKRSDIIVEIGAGLGTLTGYLAESGAKIIAIEKDRLLTAHLKNKFKNHKNVTIKEEDILKFNPADYQLQTTNYKLVGNIPFYLTSHLIKTVFEEWLRPEKIVLMLQKEVALRIVAKPPDMSPERGREGSQRASASYGMSLLAVSVQYYSKPEIISYVSAGSFYPSPKVDSAIIRLVPSEQFTAYRETTENCKLKTVNFFKVVRAGFAGKRKQLLNNLARDLKLPKEKIESELLVIGIDPKRRAETLTIEEWQKITNSLFPQD